MTESSFVEGVVLLLVVASVLIVVLIWAILVFCKLSSMVSLQWNAIKELQILCKVQSDTLHALDQIRANTAPLARAEVEYSDTQ